MKTKVGVLVCGNTRVAVLLALLLVSLLLVVQLLLHAVHVVLQLHDRRLRVLTQHNEI